MTDVVLDENIYIKAIQAECTEDPTDRTAASTVQAVQQRHRWVFSRDILDAYRRQFSRATCKGAAASRLMKSLNEVMFDARRFCLLDDPKPVVGSFDPDDQHVVSAAASASAACLLVTTDGRLKRALDAAGIPERHGFSVLELEAAHILLLGAQDPGFE